MEKRIITIGFAPTRRAVFSKEEAGRFKNIILEKIKGYDGVEIVDIEDINDEGLLHEETDYKAVIAKFKAAKVDGVFFPHCNFGSEFMVSRVAKGVGKPVLLWGPRDDSPNPDGTRSRDSQCGLFATGKVLRRHRVPFTYLPNTAVDSVVFTEGFRRFVSVCAVVKAFQQTKVLQVSTRPDPFWTMIINEGEILERFGIEVFPLAMPDLVKLVHKVIEEKGPDFTRIKKKVIGLGSEGLGGEDNLNRVVGLAAAILEVCKREELNCVAIQCWNCMQDVLDVMPCMVNGLLAEEGIPVGCETDIMGAISSVMLQEAARRESAVFFADLTVRHPTDDNTELLWHCGNFPMELAKDPKKAMVGCHFILPSHSPGTGEWEIKGGDITICRLDGDNGEYSMFMGEGVGTDGPANKGTYVWFKVPNWDKWEYKLVTGPYVHHCAGVHQKVAAVLHEVCKYIGVTPDPTEPTAAEIERVWLKGE